jgi:hypothetical protein
MKPIPVICILIGGIASVQAESIMDKPHPVFGVPMGVVLLVFVAIAALKRK